MNLLGILIIGILSGLGFSVPVLWALHRSVQRMDDPPSPSGVAVASLLTVLLTGGIIGPMFSFVYANLFLRLVPDLAPWAFGGLNTLVLGLLVNLYAWRRHYPDLRVIFALNLCAAFCLGWLIPFLYKLLLDA